MHLEAHCLHWVVRRARTRRCGAHPRARRAWPMLQRAVITRTTAPLEGPSATGAGSYFPRIYAGRPAAEWTLLARLQRLGRVEIAESLDRVIGCVAVTQSVFFAPDEWVAVPADWSRKIVSGRAHDRAGGEGGRLWAACLERTAARRDP